MSTGADSKTMAITPEYAEGHERVFGKRQAQPGRWIYLPDGTAIPAEQSVTPETEDARVAPVMVDRFYEGAHVERMEPDEKKGTAKVVTYDLGSRKRHRDYLKRYGLTTTDDFDKPGGYWERAAKDREKVRLGDNDRKERRESIARALYEVEQKQRRRKP